MQYNTAGSGLEKVFKWYTIMGLEALMNSKDGMNSREVHKYINSKESISRASVINRLNDWVDEGLLTYTETTGKGGHHRIYFLEMNEQELKDWITRKLLEDLVAFNPNGELLESVKL